MRLTQFLTILNDAKRSTLGLPAEWYAPQLAEAGYGRTDREYPIP